MEKLNNLLETECYNPHSFFDSSIEEPIISDVVFYENKQLFLLDSHPHGDIEEHSSSYEMEQIDLNKAISKENFSIGDQYSSRPLCRQSQGTAAGTDFSRYSSDQGLSESANKFHQNPSYNERGHFLSSRPSTDDYEENAYERSEDLPMDNTRGPQSFEMEEQSRESSEQHDLENTEVNTNDSESSMEANQRNPNQNPVESQTNNIIQIKNALENLIKKANNLLIMVNDPNIECPLVNIIKTIIRKAQLACEDNLSFEIVSQISYSLKNQLKSKKFLNLLLGKKLSESSEIDKFYKRVYCDSIIELTKHSNLEYYVMNSTQFKRIYVDRKGFTLRDVFDAYKKKTPSISREVETLREKL